MRLQDKVAIITGGASGFGEASVRLFVQEGAQVVIADIDSVNGERVQRAISASGEHAAFVETNILDEQQVQTLVAQVVDDYGHIDILVNSAGVWAKGTVLTADKEQWDRVMGVNLWGAILCCKYAVAQMQRQGKGTIVNVSSEAGLVAWENQVLYNASKAGMIMFTKSLVADFAREGIRANCVCPGTSRTPLVESFLATQPNPEELRRSLESIRPANRLGRPEEIAQAVCYLASDESPFAMGAVLSVDGGSTAI